MLEFPATLRRAAGVAAYHDVTLLAEQVVPVIRRAAPAVVDRIDTRAAIDGHVDRVQLGRIEVGGLHHPAVQLLTGIAGEREELPWGHRIIGQRLLQTGIVFEQTDLAPLAVAQDIHRRGVRIAVVVDGVVKRLAPPHPMGSRRLVQLRHPPLQVHLGQMLLRGPSPGAGEIDHFPLGIIALHGGDVPIAGGQLLVGLSRTDVVEVVVPILHARHDERAVLQEREVVLNGDVRRGLLDQNLLGLGRAPLGQHFKIETKQLHAVLMAVHPHHHQHLSLPHPHDAGDVVVRIYPGQNRFPPGGHVHHMDADL